jgi:hypothetical protein
MLRARFAMPLLPQRAAIHLQIRLRPPPIFVMLYFRRHCHTIISDAASACQRRR